MIPEFPCKDCGINTCPLQGEREYYEVHDALWASVGAPGTGQSDNGVQGFFLCIGCLEDRLGRKLTPDDFKPYPANTPSPWLTERLNNRLDGLTPVFRKLPEHARCQQFFPDALYDVISAVYQPYWFHRDYAGATTIGIFNERYRLHHG